jgi:preprotein translocase subunit SecF
VTVAVVGVKAVAVGVVASQQHDQIMVGVMAVVEVEVKAVTVGAVAN